MKQFCETIWEDGEYNYPAAYGFVPNLHAYLHDDDEDRDCMLVIPGGGYCVCTPHEGELVAEEFYDRGMNTFVLTYTTDITMSVPLKDQPLKDISRAVRFIRKRAAEYKIAGKKFIICGFSAGAHVCGTLAVHYEDVVDGNSSYSDISNRPDGAILAYPVITSGEFTHIYSIQALLGKNPTQEELDYYSIEKQVKESTPSCFIWQTEEDELVPVENSYLMAEALRKKHVPFAHYVFPKGFHGLSVANEAFFKGWSGGMYSMEQVFKAVDAVKAGKGVNVSDERCAELKAQFTDDAPSGPPEGFVIDESLQNDTKYWPAMAEAWINRL
jgi:acetyl esterase/lipase